MNHHTPVPTKTERPRASLPPADDDIVLEVDLDEWGL